MVDYSNKKIPIYSGINDQPIEPTAESGGNISHFYNLYNSLVDIVQVTVTNQGNIYAEIRSLEYSFEQLSSLVNSLDTRITAIQQGSSLGEQTFTFTGVNLGIEQDGYYHGAVGIIPMDGKITKVTVDSITDMFDTYVIIDSPGEGDYFNDFIFLSIGDYIDTGKGYEMEIMDNGDNDVFQGQTLVIESAGQETNLTVTVTIYGILSTSEPTLEVYEFSGISTTDLGGGNYGATIGTIPKTGKLQKIAVNDINNGYDIFFSTNGGNSVLTLGAFDITTEGYQWTINDDNSQDVTQGDQLTFQTPDEELNRTFYLSIYG